MATDNFFQGKRAVVTGAGQGLGRAVVKALDARGASVLALDRNADRLQTLTDECKNVTTGVVDVTNWDETRGLLTEFGDIDLVVNNVGVTRPATFLDATKEDMETSLTTNVLPAMNVSQVAARSMVARQCGGAILNVCTLGTRAELPMYAVYCSSKTALERLTKSMAQELGPKKIRVNSIHPVLINTASTKFLVDNPTLAQPFLDKVALGRFAEEDDVVAPALFLLDASRSGMVTGQSLFVDGGYQ